MEEARGGGAAPSLDNFYDTIPIFPFLFGLENWYAIILLINIHSCMQGL